MRSAPKAPSVTEEDDARADTLRRVVCRFSKGELRQLDALRAQFPGTARAALVRALCVYGMTVPANELPQRLQGARARGAGARGPRSGVPMVVQLLALVKASADVEVTVDLARSAVQASDAHVVRSALARLAERGEIHRVGPGRYRAVAPASAHGGAKEVRHA